MDLIPDLIKLQKKKFKVKVPGIETAKSWLEVRHAKHVITRILKETCILQLMK